MTTREAWETPEGAQERVDAAIAAHIAEDSDDNFDTGVGDPEEVTPDASPDGGASGFASRLDHQHGVDTYASTPAATAGTGSAGTSGTAPSRGNHAHAVGFGATAGQDVTPDVAGTTGSGQLPAHADHTHKLTTYTSTPEADSGAGSAGTSAAAPSRGDHVHPSSGGGSPTGSAGGDLADTYPNPTVAKASKSFALTGDISPTQITSTQNDYAPTGLADATILRLDLDTNRTITGLTGGSDGRVVIIQNLSAFTLTLSHESASSTSTNRFNFPNSISVTVKPGAALILYYDATLSGGRWKTPYQTFSKATPLAGANVTVDAAAGGGTTGAYADEGHGHRLDTYSSAAAAPGTAAAGTSTTAPSRGDHVHPSSGWNADLNQVKVEQDLYWVGQVTDSSTGTLDNWNPTGWSTATSIRWTGASAATLDNLAGAAAGRIAIIINASAQTMTIKHNTTGGGTTANNFKLPNSVDMKLGPNETVAFYYSNGDLAWRPMGQEFTYASNAAALGTASAGTAGEYPSRGDHVHPTTGLALDSHGAAQHTDVTRYIWVPVKDMSLNSGTSGTAGSGTTLTDIINLADSATQGLYFETLIPDDFSSGLTIVPYWMPSANDGSAHTVQWSVTYLIEAAGQDITAAGTTTAWTGSSASRTQNNLVIDTGQSMSGGAAGNLLRVALQRIGADAADTYVGIVKIVGVRIEYTANQ